MRRTVVEMHIGWDKMAKKVVSLIAQGLVWSGQGCKPDVAVEEQNTAFAPLVALHSCLVGH